MPPILSNACPKSIPSTRNIADYVTSLEAGNFSISGGLVIREGVTAKGDATEDTVCNFIAWITEDREIHCSTGLIRHALTIEGWSFKSKRSLPPVTIDATELDGGKWVAKHWGSAALVYPAGKKHIAEMIHETSLNIQSAHTLTRTGWIDFGSGWEFLHAGGSIGPSSVQVDLAKPTGSIKLKHYDLPKDPMPLAAVSKTACDFLEIAAPKLTYPLFAVVMLAPLGELMRQNGTPIDFTPFLVGKSQSGKSSLAATCLSFFGSFDKTSFPANFTDTANSLEAKLEALQDVLGVVDDFFPSSPEQMREMKAVVRKLVRATTDGNSRSRFSQTTRVPRAFMLCTGEARPNLTPSDMNRILFLDVDRSDIHYSGEYKRLWARRDELRHFTVHYIRWIAVNWDTLKKKINAIQRHLNRIGARFDHCRTLNATMKLALGFEIGVSFLHESGCIDRPTARQFRRQAGSIFLTLLSKEIEHDQAMSPGEMYLEAVSALVQSKKAAITPVTQRQVPAGWIGCCDAHTAYLQPSTSFEAAKNFYARQGIAFPVSAKEVWRDLEKMSVISYDQVRKRYTRQKKLLCRSSAPTDLLFIDRSQIVGL